MVNKAIFPIIVAIPILLIGAYFILPQSGSNQPTAEQGPINDLAELLRILVANEVPLEMMEGGVVVREAEQPFFSVDAQVIKIYGEDVQIFEYPTLSAAENDMVMMILTISRYSAPYLSDSMLFHEAVGLCRSCGCVVMQQASRKTMEVSANGQ